MIEPVQRIEWPGKRGEDHFLREEWLVTNGLGGYASGTIAGMPTRRFHGLLVAALPAPLGRTMMFNYLGERLRLPNGSAIQLSCDERGPGAVELLGAEYLAEFRLEMGLPVWRYEINGLTLEKRLLMLHLQNTVHVTYKLLSGGEPVRLELRPAFFFRPHEGRVSDQFLEPCTLTIIEDRYEIKGRDDYPPLRLRLRGREAALTLDQGIIKDQFYRVEALRGYDSQGALWSPGYFHVTLIPGEDVTLIASTESWATIFAISPHEAPHAERVRRGRLLSIAAPPTHDQFGADLTLAADQFVIIPVGRIEEAARAHAVGDEVRTVIAGYHWFTDWGRDTMIGLEGLTLVTGRFAEAGWILRTFAHYVRDGLIPNMFPEGETEGRYHTADATLWFFHALDRYLQVTGDLNTLRQVLPTLRGIVKHHIEGTRFGIGVDPRDGLLSQGAEGYQLTWMDAKCGDWVVTPRRGKAVEINALWYNALRLLAGWVSMEDSEAAARNIIEQSEITRQSFNDRFWYPRGGYLYDVVDGEQGDDAACRPNQILSFSLKYPALVEDRWKPVLDVVTARLLTPVGLRSLAPEHPEYKSTYDGDLRSRDAAYHQGTVWAWLIGPFIDAWLRVHPGQFQSARRFLEGFKSHLNEACVGSISEIFDAEKPFAPRGCAAQAWSVAEVLRSYVKTSQ
ncbi:MAG: amylo-alpha-1,6-glucosidase [Blastocatellales bacterium]